MINSSYSKVINSSEKTSLSSNNENETSKINIKNKIKSKTKNQNLLSQEEDENNNNINININKNDLNELDDYNIEKENPIEEEDDLKPLNNRKGNTFMFLYTKNLFPLIVIGPHCKIIK